VATSNIEVSLRTLYKLNLKSWCSLMNSYCIGYNKHLMFAKPTLAPASVAICKLALNEVNLGLDMRTIRYALGIGQDMLQRKFSSITTDSFKLKFTKDAKLGRKFTQELIRLVAKGILVPSQAKNTAKVYQLNDGTFVQKWELTKALSEDILEQPYLNTFFVHMNKKGKTKANFPPWEDRNYKFSIDHSKGDPHKIYERITVPEWTEEDLNMINSKDDWKVLNMTSNCSIEKRISTSYYRNCLGFYQKYF